MELRCRECGALLLREDVNEDVLTAYCRVCETSFSFAADLADQVDVVDPFGDDPFTAPDPTTMDHGLMEPPLPSFLHVHVDERHLVVEQDWLQRGQGLASLGALSALALATAMTLWVAWGGLSAVLLLPVAYTLSCYGWNRSRVVLGDQSVVVHNGPLPWIGARQVERTRIVAVTCSRELRPRSHAFAVRLALEDGGTVTVAHGMPTEVLCRHIKHRIARRLGLAPL